MSIDDHCNKIRTNGKNKNEIGHLAIEGDTITINTRMEKGRILQTNFWIWPDWLSDSNKKYLKEIRLKKEERIKNSLSYRTLKFLGLYKR